MELAEMRWPEADAVEDPIALLPVGSTEQHGPHAPLGTDCLTVEAVASGAAERTDVILAPTIPVGVAAEHRHFAGTLWVEPTVFRDYVGGTIRSLAYHGWDRIVVVNGHGGNVDALRELCAKLTRGEDLYAVPFTWFDEIDTGQHAMGHAGPIETAALRSLEPGLIEETQLDGAATHGSERWGEWQGRVNLAYDTREFSENGAVGDPRETTVEDGEWYLRKATNALVELIDRVRDRQA